VTPQFLVAGAVALVAAAIHGGAGEAKVLRMLFSGELPSTSFGGPTFTKAMIRVTWHVATVTFAVLGSALATCGFLGPGNGCGGIGVVAASAFTGFVVLTIPVILQRPSRLLGHPGPIAFLAVAALAWWGVTTA
jgi:hypothetical protein